MNEEKGDVMKLLVSPKEKDLSKRINQGVTSFLVGLTGFCTNCDCTFSLEELKKFRKEYPFIELFLIMNKNLFNQEIPVVEELLTELNSLSIHGIFFYDQAILSIHQRLHLKTPLVWNQTYMVTNYNTCNYYYQQGVEYGVLASEITLDEMLEIQEKSKMKLMATILGYPAMSHSNRKLLSNYFSFIQKEKEKKYYHITEPKKEHPYFLEEDSTGTSIYEGLLLNGTGPLFSLKEAGIAYGILVEKEIDDEKLDLIIPMYLEIMKKDHISDSEKEKYLQKSITILKSDYTGFFYRKTIYKVKRNG